MKAAYKLKNHSVIITSGFHHLFSLKGDTPGSPHISAGMNYLDKL